MSYHDTHVIRMVVCEMLVGYVRVSAADDRQSADLQRDALLSAGVDHLHIYEDHASVGHDARLGLMACLASLRRGDVLVVWKLDRLGRSLSHLIATIKGLQRRSVGLRSLSEAIDTTAATGEVVFHVFGAIAKYEDSLIQERVNAGLRAAKRRAKISARPRQVDDEKIQAARALLETGMAVSSVARSVGVPRSTLVESMRRFARSSERK